MKTLPPETRPPRTRIERRHQPEPATGRYGYRRYRSCLRWEFGFSCAFCLLHETDFSQYGAERLGLMWIEHFQPISSDEDQVNEYKNCFYSCRLCNRSRSVAPLVDSRGAKLLNPCDNVWAEHFEGTNDQLLPRLGDADAKYTHAVYNLDDPAKVMMRKSRRETITLCLALLREGSVNLQRLIDRAEPEGLIAAKELRSCIKLAIITVKRYLAIPRDADRQCRCNRSRKLALPAELERQTIDIEVPV